MKRESRARRDGPCAIRIGLIVCIVALGLFSGGCSRIKPVAMHGDTCLRSQYEQYIYYHPTEIRDHDPAGVAIGPLRISESGGPLQNVILCLRISHRSTADVDIWLRYDTDHDGIPNASAPVEFHRGRADGCGARAPHACTMELEGVYWFKDGDVSDPDQPFAVFNGLARGGEFYLSVADTLAKDVGTIANWSVYVEKTELLTCR